MTEPRPGEWWTRNDGERVFIERWDKILGMLVVVDRGGNERLYNADGTLAVRSIANDDADLRACSRYSGFVVRN